MPDTHVPINHERPAIHLIHNSSAVLLELPVSVVQGTYLSRLQPARNAVEMEGMLSTRLA